MSENEKNKVILHCEELAIKEDEGKFRFPDQPKAGDSVSISHKNLRGRDIPIGWRATVTGRNYTRFSYFPVKQEKAEKCVNTSESARESVEKSPNKANILPLCSDKRKEYPIFSGLLAYFPDACAAVAHQSYLGNEKHNPGMNLHWSRETSNDHLDCIARHMVDQLDTELDSVEEKTAAAWRALAELQLAIEEKKQEKKSGNPISSGT